MPDDLVAQAVSITVVPIAHILVGAGVVVDRVGRIGGERDPPGRDSACQQRMVRINPRIDDRDRNARSRISSMSSLKPERFTDGLDLILARGGEQKDALRTRPGVSRFKVQLRVIDVRIGQEQQLERILRHLHIEVDEVRQA
jgi:hypothetical protein